MGKRSERFSGKKLLSGIDKLTGREVHIILWEGSTFFGDVVEASKSFVKIKDKNIRWYNRKGHTHNLKLDDIREIILDNPSKW